MFQNQVSLKNYNSFGIDVKAEFFVSVKSLGDLVSVLETNPLKMLVLGGGNNVLLTKDVKGLVVHINLKGIKICEKNKATTVVKASAGENWNDFVSWTLNHNLGGLENLALIPGNVGTAPIQNIGAYGVELKDSLVNCEALNLKTLEIETFSNADCKFGYRNSVFKSKYKGQYIITAVRFELTNSNHLLRTSYGSIQSKLKKNGVHNNPTIHDISEAVISIRRSKLPDPKKLGNSGSFFKNPIVTKKIFEKLQKHFPDIPHFKIANNKLKIPAAWLIETAGFKGKTFLNCGVHKQQALVLVNYGGASGQDILALSQLIQKTVLIIFNISLEPEVDII